MKIKLTTREELCQKANEVEGLHHEESPRITFWVKFTKKLKEFRFIFRF